MAHGEELKFQRQQDKQAVLGVLCVILAQGAQTLRWILVQAEQGIDLFDSLRDPVFEQREENIFLAVKIGVERSRV